MSNYPTWPGWETVRRIGAGSFGAVYEIERDMFGEKEKAALKMITIPQGEDDIDELRSDGYDDESITTTFQSHLKSIVSEYSLMRKLNGSANVVNCDDVHYVQHADGIGWDVYIKMELLTPLKKALPEQIPEGLACRIGIDLCKALVQCQKMGIIHRDIKPENIFVSAIGDYKLGDFGIAKTMEKTCIGTKAGTYKYMAPEVYNNRPYGAGADIYSLGMVLYWLLNERRMPFLPLPPEKLSGEMDQEACLRRLHGEAIPAPAHGSDLLKRIVLKACAYLPEDRYHTAGEMLAELEALKYSDRTVLKPAPKPQPKPEPAPDPIAPTVGIVRNQQTTRQTTGGTRTDADNPTGTATVGAFGAQKVTQIFCEKCGAQIAEGEKYCRRCGARQTPEDNLQTEPPKTKKPRTGIILCAVLGALLLTGAGIFLSGAIGRNNTETGTTSIENKTTVGTVAETERKKTANIERTSAETEQAATKSTGQATASAPEKSEEEQAYEAAEALLNSGKLISAYDAFQQLGSYSDSASRAAAIKTNHPVCFTSVGSYVEFGSYDQDGKSGKEPIEWLVVEKGSDYVIMVSRYALANRLFHETKESVSWGSSDLRRWLNNSFYTTAFSAEQQQMIAESAVITAGTTTYDKVYLLSIAEAESYFSSDSARACKATKATISAGAVTNSDGNVWWWLRSPGKSGTMTAGVYGRGAIDSDGDIVNQLSSKTGKAPNGVRPVIRVAID